MIKTILLLLLFGFSAAEASARTTCKLDPGVAKDDEGQSLYICGAGKKQFRARCDGSTDAEYATPPVAKAVWAKVGDSEGIEFKGGSVVCTKVKSRS